ncbi:hypothetical protein LHJ74_07220 [Streptomyces sp. N2-109]|uniref:Carbon monoxide dehydrogenase subunit G n=1 Tax=Streptomyces gossypii TaxID=2883101 RepID=A0ABT2JPG1_9ACTN|nr:hypothetical protein [Streptomyces gossypii]MCT2589711.1 hypothetical protein [Streptomyces gossypii]
MEHEVYVPFPVGSVREALADRVRVARSVPGFQQAAAEGRGDAVEGRLRLRIGGSTITYRGELKITAQGDGFSVKASGAEVRGQGAVRLVLKVVPRPSADGEGTRLVCSGKLSGDGRIAEFEEKVTAAAGRRLLDRFATALTERMRNGSGAGSETRAAAGIGEPDDNDRAIPGIPAPEKGEQDRSRKEDGKGKDDGSADAEARPGTDGEEDTPRSAEGGPADSEATPGVFGTEVPPPSLDPLDSEDGLVDEVDGQGGPEDADDDADGEPVDDGEGRLTAEAAHARRTMIGRSAEEVDHAPPRGRYAPVPAADSTAAAATLRWAAPAAALVVAGAVILGRALRRRR